MLGREVTDFLQSIAWTPAFPFVLSIGASVQTQPLVSRAKSVEENPLTGLPVGLSIFGTAWSEAKLIGMAFACEQSTKALRPPRYLATLPV
jgi:hypothetical protein